MKLAIISHTPHYKINGEIVGWGATIRELDHLTKIFDQIYHLAPLHENEAPQSSLAYTSDKIEFIPLKPSGGTGFKDKVGILTNASYNIKKIKQVMDKVEWFQFRAPTSLGLYVIPYLSYFRKNNLWVKYAGNWKQRNAPLSYSLQRWWLQNNLQNSKVTVNGKWTNQQSHVISFENPCLDETERIEGKFAIENKDYSEPLNFLFVGRIEEEKGVGRIIETLSSEIFQHRFPRIKKVTFIGGGPDLESYKEKSKKVDLDIEFTGEKKRSEINEYYKSSHILLLPSTASEGFPKVIAEACNYGVVPIVSNVSSITHYIQNSINGYIWPVETISFPEFLSEVTFDHKELKDIASKAYSFSEKFTYSAYNKKLLEEILTDNE